MYEKPTAKVIVNSQKRKLSLYNQKQDMDVYYNHAYSVQFWKHWLKQLDNKNQKA